MSRTKRTLASLASLTVLAAAGAAVTLAAPAQAASSVGGTITRSEVIARAQSWVDQGVPYNQSANHTDSNGTYREDCSGYVSMAWHLSSSLTTWTLPNVSTKISFSQLKPGDAMDYTDAHTFLFAGWTNQSTGAFTYYAESNSHNPTHGPTSANINNSSLEGWPTGYYDALRYDNIVDDAAAPAWKSQVVVNGGGAIFHGLRNADGTWSGFGNIASQAGDIGNVGSIADAGVNGDTHVVAVGGNGHIFHTIRRANGTWGAFGDVNAAAGALSSVTKVSAVSTGTEVSVLAVADGKLNHSVRHADGTWTAFADVSGEAGALPAPVTSAAEAWVNGQLQVAVVAGGRVYHSVRSSGGTWTPWGDVYTAAGDAGTATDVAVAGTGSDMQIIVTSNGGAKQFHGARLANGTWMPLTDLTSVLGSFTSTGVSAAAVNGELQATFVTTDNRILHTIRRVNATWTGAGAINLNGVTGNHYAASITGSL
ncbi:hypothetical protein [Streptomyces sp. NBC_00503]|uniref:hypothetical protein n=1 Tax=Streptomyces sp. NBC_00503 TaxID=2903659 RepID=UPI002E80973F|nr:hypothetical protein [Streptomyces sp. NBC_00503]WUD82001.1 hypothetical protein OG490_16425 [Streptomyces sp. NBC_00503]